MTKRKAEEDAAKEKLDCFLVAGLLYFSASDLLRMGMGTAETDFDRSRTPDVRPPYHCRKEAIKKEKKSKKGKNGKKTKQPFKGIKEADR